MQGVESAISVDEHWWPSPFGADDQLGIDTNKLRISTGAHWSFLADENLELQRALDINEYTDTHHDATVLNTLVLAPGLVIDKVYVGYWFWGRPSPHQLWSDLQDLHARIKVDFDPTADGARAAWEAAKQRVAS